MHILVIFDHLRKTIRPETTADVLNRWKHGGKVPVFFFCLFVFFFAGRSVTFLLSDIQYTFKMPPKGMQYDLKAR